MASVIRDIADETAAPGTPIWVWGVAILLGLIILGCGAAAAFNAAAIGWPAILLLGGMALVGVFGLLSLLLQSRPKAKIDRRLSERGGAYAEAFFKNPESTVIIDNGKVIHANEAYLALAKQMGAMSLSEAAPPVDRLFSASNDEAASAIFRLHHMHASTESAIEIVDTLDAEGALHRYRIHVTNLKPQQLWQITDVTAETFGEEAVLVSAPVGLFSVTRDGQVIATNSVLDRWLGGEDNIRPDYLREFIENPDALLESPAAPGRVIRTDTRLITRKGVVTPSIMVGTWNELDSGDLVASVALYGHSSLGVQKAAVATDKSAAPLAANDKATGFSSAPVAILHLDGENLGKAIVKSANPAFERMSGGLSWEGLPFAEVFTPNEMEHRFLNLTAYECETDKPFDATLSGANGLPVSVYIVPDPEVTHSIWAYLVDTSARKSLEDQLVQSQKMQAIGQLAAGVAHDFNNKKLLAFSRKQTRRMELLSVTETLSEMIVTLKQTLGERAKLNVVHGRDLPPVRADKSQIDTVLMNLCVNARDAMEDQGGGTITISSRSKRRQDIDDLSVTLALKAITGDEFIIIEVSDTGTGMTDEVKSKIFEPFFTTKEVGKGTGLGLATVYGIVQQSGGHLTVDSELLEDAEEPFDLMISDVVMPGMDGPTLLKKGRDMLGDARIVFISGYAEEEFSELLSEEPDVTFLPKPFTLAQLAEKVKAEIGESEG